MAVPTGVDPHEVLGVLSGASPAEVTAAYRRLAKRWHPDRAPVGGAADRMALINAAYDELRADEGATRPAPRRGWSTSAPASGGPGTGSGPHRGGTGAGPGQRPPVWPPQDPDARPDGARGPGRSPRGDAPPPPLDPTGAGPGGWAAGVLDADPEPDPRADDGLTPAVRSALGAELRSALAPGEEVGIVVPASTWASPQTTLAVTDRRLLWLLDDAPVHRVRVLLLSDVVDVAVRPPRLWRPRAQVVCTDRRGRRTTFGELEPATAAAVARRVRPREGAPPAR